MAFLRCGSARVQAEDNRVRVVPEERSKVLERVHRSSQLDLNHYPPVHFEHSLTYRPSHLVFRTNKRPKADIPAESRGTTDITARKRATMTKVRL